MPLSFEKKLPLILLLAFIMLAAIGFFAYRSTRSLQNAVNWQKRTQEVLMKLDDALISTVDVETSARGYIISGTDNFLEPFNSGRQNALRDVEDLKALTIDNKTQGENLAQLDRLVGEKIAVSQNYIDLRRRDGLLNAVNEVSKGEGDVLMNRIRALVQQMRDEEHRLLKYREENVNATVGNNFWMMLIGSVAGIGALGLANFVVLFEIKKRKLAETSLEKRVDERTEELKIANANLRASEVFSRSVIDSLSAHIAVLDRDGKIVMVNNAWENFADVNGALGELAATGIGQNYLSVCEQDEIDEKSQEIAENLRAILDGERQHFTIEYPCHSPSEERWFLMQVNALQDSKGGVVVSHFNITDRVKAELNERKARREAEIATHLRDEFMATVSHELRTPLNAILGWAKILQSGKTSPEHNEKAIETIVRNAETQNRLIEDLMDVARVVSGKLTIERELFDPEELVVAAVETIKPKAAEKEIAVNLGFDETAAGKNISGDPNRLQQILLNLLTNAVKFTPEGGTIDVSVASENRWLEIRVRDNGAGISKDFLPFVFDRFRQDAANREKSGGLGLGLAIVRQLTELHGGSVRVESDGENQGATFTVRFPVVE